MQFGHGISEYLQWDGGPVLCVFFCVYLAISDAAAAAAEVDNYNNDDDDDDDDNDNDKGAATVLIGNVPCTWAQANFVFLF